MDNLKLDSEAISEMKSFYQEELQKAVRRLEHINNILAQLGEKGAQVEFSFNGHTTNQSSLKTTSSSKRKYRKKRGPKSKWDKTILKTITSAGRPLSYEEITSFLMISEGRDASKRKNVKATVQNTVFRMRHNKKLDTFSLGSRTKYIAPVTWFDDNGSIIEDYKSKVIESETKTKPAPKTTKRSPGRPAKAASKASTAKKAKPAATKKATSAKKTTGKKASPAKARGKKSTPKAKKAQVV